MNFPSPTAPMSASMNASVQGAELPRLPDDDLALGCECANPELQIEVWRREASPQPLQQFS